tara:strand:+ start:517 stop:1572 length:1056 start_codon:yes stop_codon:yes gene_type:complete
MSKTDYFKILESIGKDEKPSGPNDRILIVDGLNTFIRSFAANPVTNEDGIHVGGMTGFLMSIGYAIRNIKPTRVIICWDGKGGSQRRRKVFENYKANRRVRTRLTRHGNYNSQEDESMAMRNQIMRLTQYLEVLPVTMVSVENIEADDSMAYICKQLYPDSQCHIMSTDKDFLQLINKNISIWSPTKKKFYFGDTMKQEYNIPANNFLIYRTLEGDASDNIPGIRGIGLKTVVKLFPMICEDSDVSIDDIIKHANDNINGAKLYSKIIENEDTIRLNYRLMQLHDVDISGSAKEKIMNSVRSPINRLVKFEILKMIIEDNMNNVRVFKNPDYWLQNTFLSLDTYAGMTYDK